MNRVFTIAVLSLSAACTASDATAAQPAQPKAPSDLNTCVLCHTMPELFQGDKQRFLIPLDTLTEDAHFLAKVKCSGCHGGNPNSLHATQAHSPNGDESESEPGFRTSLNEIQRACDNCHQEQRLGLTEGVHRLAGPVGEDGRPTPFACQTCHGEIKHSLFPSDHRRSRTFLDNQMRLCGGCHEEDQQTYLDSVHGRGLTNSGLLVTAVCADCHGAHAIFPADHIESTLHPSHVASTCAQCHRFIEERLRKSVHGLGSGGPGGVSEKPAPGGHKRRTASCTDCHYGHNVSDPQSDRFRLGLPDRCGDCHEELSESYRMSLHGALTELGHEPAAKCSDCHGAHDILPIDDPKSPLAVGENRLATCRKCHPGAVANFCDFQPHANYEDAEAFPLLHYIHLAMELLIFSVFAFFGLHSVLWLGRAMLHCRAHGRPRRLGWNKEALVRFTTGQRILHAIVVVSFLGLAATGLPLKYSGQAWAQAVARMLGGFESTSVWHHIFGVVTLAYFVGHVVWLVRNAFQSLRRGTRLGTLIFGPDSPVPNLRDATDMFRMFRWFTGRGTKPGFERWTYWEKFDYWAVFWGVNIIGFTGLMLWFPNLFTRILPGEILNIAKVIHSEEALLATSFIFAVHFFGTHLRPEKFPMDMTILTGLITEEEMLEERPDYLERMRQEGRLEECRTAVPSRGVLFLIAVIGFVALTVGVGLLVGIVVAVFGG